MAVRQKGDSSRSTAIPYLGLQGLTGTVHLRFPGAGTWAVRSHTAGLRLPNSLTRRLPGLTGLIRLLLGVFSGAWWHTRHKWALHGSTVLVCVCMNSRGQLWAGLCECLSQRSQTVGLPRLHCVFYSRSMPPWAAGATERNRHLGNWAKKPAATDIWSWRSGG